MAHSSMRVRSRFKKREVQEWADRYLPGWKAQSNDNLNGWELFDPETAWYGDWEFIKCIVEAARRGPS